MATDIADLLELVKTKVETVDGLKAVYNHAIDVSAGYPFATVREGGWEGEFSDTSRTRRIFRYEIYLFQEVSEQTFDQAKGARVIREIQDEVISAFDADPTLSGNVLLVQPVSGSTPEMVDRPANAWSVIVTVECHKLVTR